VLERLADPERHPAKAASRDLGPLLAAGALAATTVSATMRAAHLAGIEIFATGGIGGVHRGASLSWDVSSDIDELAATPVGIVCSGAKSILDLRATAELLETRRVPVVGFATRELPAFYSVSSGIGLTHIVDDAAQAAATLEAHLALPGAAGLLFVNPPPVDVALPAEEVERWIEEATALADAARVRAGAVTPFVLGHVARASGGRTLRANIGLIVNNAATAARVAVALVERRAGG
jgi:pseudouridine-5'-phosphate glycosidase